MALVPVVAALVVVVFLLLFVVVGVVLVVVIMLHAQHHHQSWLVTNDCSFLRCCGEVKTMKILIGVRTWSIVAVQTECCNDT